MSPSPEWYEPPDLIDDDRDDPDQPTEILTTSARGGWWSMSLIDSEVDDA